MLKRNKPSHLLSARDLSRDDISDIIERSKHYRERVATRALPQTMVGRVVATLFVQPSTRTRLSFESAVHRLGGSCIGFSDPNMSKAGGEWRESMPDTARVLNGYADAVVIRHNEVGAVNLYAEESAIPVINGGDGRGVYVEHPTQALIDLFSLESDFGNVEGLKILIVGHVNQRCVHSLLLLLAKFSDVTVFLVTENTERLSEHEERELQSIGLRLEYVERLEEVIERVDAIYIIGTKSPTDVAERLILDPEILKLSAPHARVYHPLPRGIELPPQIDASRKASYFRQVGNGVPVRMAVLDRLLASNY
jgi:aspartate carbamoyltransferase catalytic subunit